MRLPGQPTEREFSDAVVEYARLCGWRVHRDPYWRPTATDAGYPDLTLARDGKVIFAELKVGRGRRTKAQECWAIAIYGMESPKSAELCRYYEWRPDDWPMIEAVLL